MNKPAQNRPWPPIILSANIPVWTRVRDGLLAIVGWLIVQDLLLDFWVLMYDWLKDPIFELAPADSPDWSAIGARLAPFAIISGLLVTGIVLTAMQRRGLITRSLETESAKKNAALATGDTLGSPDSPTHELQCLRIADVHIDARGGIERVTPRSGR